MGISIVTAPVVRPITLAEAKDHLKEDSTDHDARIETLIDAAVAWAEDYTGRALCTQTIDWTLDRWPANSVLQVPRPPLQSVTSVKYIDENGGEQTVDAADYQTSIDGVRGLIVPAYGVSWPSARDDTLNAVTVRAVVGYGEPQDVPAPIRAAMLLILADLYDEAGNYVVGTSVASVPTSAHYLAGPYRAVGFA